MDCQKHLFSLPEDHHYINCAYMSPMLKSVEEAGMAGIRQKRQPWHIIPDDFFENSNRLRRLFANLVGAQKPGSVALMPAVSYGMATAARNLDAGNGHTIVIAGEQFPSNVYVWKRLCQESGCRLHVVKAPEDFNHRGQKWNERILDAINADTLLVALSNVHWADGTLFDLETIGNRAREAGAYFVVDGTQSVGALPIDVQKIKADALICAGYKWLMGPYSMALGYFGERLSGGVPLEEGWITRKDSENFAGLVNYTDEYQPGAVRYDVGERSNFILVPMMTAALQQILEWEPQNIQRYCRKLTKNLVQKLPGLGYQIENPDWRGHHLFGIRLPEHLDTAELQQKLKNNHIHVSLRGSAVRISPNVYNTQEDIESLMQALSGMYIK